MTSNTAARASLAPKGLLRATINLGNPILASLRGESKEPVGVSVDLAKELAKRLGVPIELIVLDAAGKAVEAVKSEQADIGFFAIDPLRGEGIAFTAAYVLIEGFYLVPKDSLITANAHVDRAGNRVAVGKGSAYDLFLSRELKAAQIVRAPTSPTVVDTFVAQKLEVAAGVKQQLEADLRRFPGHRLLPSRFMEIQQAMGLPKTRGDAAHAYLSRFVEDMKANGFVAEALNRHSIQGASVAPAA